MAFYPVYSAKADAGEYGQSLFVVVFISLVLSWLISMTVTPLNCMALLKPPEEGAEEKDPYDTGFFRRYKAILEGAIARRFLTIGVMCVLLVLVALYENNTGTSAGIYYMHAPEFIDGAYFEANQRIDLDAHRYIRFSGQYTWQEPVGDEIAGDIDAKHYGLRATWKHGWYSGSLAWTDYPDENRIRSPWGSIPGYTSVMIKDFDRPEESAWLVGATADFSHWGARGFKANVKYTEGDTPDCGKNASPDQSEWDLNLDYAPQHPTLAGLNLRLRMGWVDQDDTCGIRDGLDVADVRLILNYAFEF